MFNPRQPVSFSPSPSFSLHQPPSTSLDIALNIPSTIKSLEVSPAILNNLADILSYLLPRAPRSGDEAWSPSFGCDGLGEERLCVVVFVVGGGGGGEWCVCREVKCEWHFC